MMKSIVAFLAFVGMIASVSAGNKRCGLGSKFFGQDKSALFQSSEITINAISTGDASITYGTSGCTHDGLLFNESIGMTVTEEELLYVNANFEELKIEMAQGQGELLLGFAETMGCGESYANFQELTKKSYSEMMGQENVTPESVLLHAKRICTNS